MLSRISKARAHLPRYFNKYGFSAVLSKQTGNTISDMGSNAKFIPGDYDDRVVKTNAVYNLHSIKLGPLTLKPIRQLSSNALMYEVENDMMDPVTNFVKKTATRQSEQLKSKIMVYFMDSNRSVFIHSMGFVPTHTMLALRDAMEDKSFETYLDARRNVIKVPFDVFLDQAYELRCIQNMVQHEKNQPNHETLMNLFVDNACMSDTFDSSLKNFTTLPPQKQQELMNDMYEDFVDNKKIKLRNEEEQSLSTINKSELELASLKLHSLLTGVKVTEHNGIHLNMSCAGSDFMKELEPTFPISDYGCYKGDRDLHSGSYMPAWKSATVKGLWTKVYA